MARDGEVNITILERDLFTLSALAIELLLDEQVAILKQMPNEVRHEDGPAQSQATTTTAKDLPEDRMSLRCDERAPTIMLDGVAFAATSEGAHL